MSRRLDFVIDWKFPLAIIIGGLIAYLPLPMSGGLVMGTAVLLLVFINPLIGVGLTLFLGPFGALENVIFGGTVLDSGQLLLILTVGAWGARSLRNGRLTIPHTKLNLPILFFLLITFASLLDALSVVEGIQEWLKWVQILLLIWLVVDMARPLTNGISIVVGILLLAGFSQAVIGVWQFGLRGHGPEHFLVLDRFYRAYGTFEQPNPFAGFMNLTAFLALGIAGALLVDGWRAWRGGLWQRWFSWRWVWLAGLVAGVAVTASLALVMSWSRGGWLGFAAATAVLVLFWPHKRWHGVGLLLLGGGLFLLGLQLGLVPASITERLTSFSQYVTFADVRGVDINDANYSVLERLAHWQAAFAMAQDQLWLGVGFGNYEPAYASYRLLNWPDALGHAHNYYINLLAEVGVLGLSGYLVLWTAVFWQTISLLSKLKGWHRGCAVGLLATWTTLTVHHLFDKLYVNNIYIHLGVLFALLQLLQYYAIENSRTHD